MTWEREWVRWRDTKTGKRTSISHLLWDVCSTHYYLSSHFMDYNEVKSLSFFWQCILPHINFVDYPKLIRSPASFHSKSFFFTYSFFQQTSFFEILYFSKSFFINFFFLIFQVIAKNIIKRIKTAIEEQNTKKKTEISTLNI